MTMKLSTAIRLGAMLRPQTFSALWDRDGTCALGAALEAVGMRNALADDPITDIWPWATGTYFSFRCPSCPDRFGNGAGITSHLNDHHRWTREAIAAWVETVEPSDALSTPEDIVFHDYAAVTA